MDQAKPVEQAEETKKMQIQVTIEDSSAWKKKIKLQVAREEINQEFDKQYERMQNEAEIPGFRKGRVPKRLLEKRFYAEIADQVKFNLLLTAFRQIEDDHKLDILTEPDIDPKGIVLPDEGDFNFEYEVEVRPQFELPNLEGIRVEKPVVEINEQRVNEVIGQLCLRNGKLEEIESAQKDDHLTADIVYRIEGQEQPEIANDYPLWVSPCGVRAITIEGIADLLTGVKVGDKKSCSAVVPDNHPKEDWRGKKAEFDITIKSVKRMVPAELTEEFLKGVGVQTQDELRSAIEENLESQSDQDARTAMTGQIHEYLDKSVQFDLPEGVARRHQDRAVARRLQEMLMRGVPREYIEKNIEEIKSSVTETAKTDLKMSFILDKVVGKLEITVSDHEVNATVAQMAQNYGRRPERMREELAKEGRLEMLKMQLAEQKALEKLLEWAEVVDVQPGEKKE